MLTSWRGSSSGSTLAIVPKTLMRKDHSNKRGDCYVSGTLGSL